MEKLGTYELTGHLTSQNSGYSIWGFGKKNGKDYFVKQFLSPKYPDNDTVSSPERLQKKKAQCELFEQKKINIYKALNENTDGNAVRIEEFFRIESKYYISMRKIEALPLTVSDIAALDIEEVKRLCAIISHGIASIHKGRIIHADLKHDNVLFMKSNSGILTAKIIDFDSSFLETDPPKENEEIIGDLVYFSPEACLRLWGESPRLTCKMDVFSLGVLFHQYLTGVLPLYDQDESNYPGEAVAKGQALGVFASIPENIKDLITKMLDPAPDNRPTAYEAYEIFAKECTLIDKCESDSTENDTKDDMLSAEISGVNGETPGSEDGSMKTTSSEAKAETKFSPSTMSSNPFKKAGKL